MDAQIAIPLWDQEADPDALLLQVTEFLRSVCCRLLPQFPDVHRWEQTDDIFQESAVRLLAALPRTPLTSRRHLENLAAMQVRRTLIDLGRSYAISVSMNRNRWTPGVANSDALPRPLLNSSASSVEYDPPALMEWLDLHQQIERLPTEEREVFELVWYRGLSKMDIAALLEVDVRTVQRRWRSARQLLLKAIGESVLL